MAKYKAGDGFIIKIDEAYTTNNGNFFYTVKGLADRLVISEEDLDKLDQLDRAEIREENEAEVKAIELGDAEPGTTVKIAGIKWEVLDTNFYASNGEVGVFCLAKQPVEERAFDDDNCNDWKKSSLRKYLNGEYLDKLADAIGRENLLAFLRDLRSEDGLKDYGKCEDTVSLISTDEYRQYRKYISNKDNWWWTLTAYSTPNSGHSHNARDAYADGSLNSGNAYRGNDGVAPACVFLPSLMVEE